MKRKDFKIERVTWLSAIAVLFVLGAVGILWADYPEPGCYVHNRATPLMDYVPQEHGIYDTMYWELEEYDCRDCHGNNLADRHHATDTVVVDGLCTYCHEVIFDPPYVIAIRDCLTSGCHSWPDDVEDNGWHHYTDLSASGNCITCHDPNLIEEITPFRDFTRYPPSIITPTPYSCDNCHWPQDHSSEAPGHPSTFDHGDPPEFYWYSTPTYRNFDTHHMQFKGRVVVECYECHSLDPNDTDWNPYNPELIRYCERCHSAQSLHGIRPHVQDTNGWEAVGFHVPGDPGEISCEDYDPTVYREFAVNEMCFGCHGDNVERLPEPGECDGNKPVIDTSVDGIQPKVGVCRAIVTLRGDHFGEEHDYGRTAQMREKGGDGPWVDVPIFSWTETRIEFQIPCWTFEPNKNYKVRVKTECGPSNKVGFTLKDWVHVDHICTGPPTPCIQAGPCGISITIVGDNFGNQQSEMFGDGYHGVHRVVDIVSAGTTLTAKKYLGWSETSIEVKLWKFFEDGIDPSRGDRNFAQDDGTQDCPDEPTLGCDHIFPGTISIYVTAVYYGDEDSSGDLSCGDTIFQVVTSEPTYFNITEDPYINRNNPTAIERNKRLKIYGVNFGGLGPNCEVHLGKESQYDSDPLTQGMIMEGDDIKLWSNTLIKVKLKAKEKWEGTTKYVWVVTDALDVSNKSELEILEPLLTP